MLFFVGMTQFPQKISDAIVFNDRRQKLKAENPIKLSTLWLFWIFCFI